MNRFLKPFTGNLRQFGMLFALAGLVFFFQIRTNGLVLTSANMINLLNGNAYILVLAIGREDWRPRALAMEVVEKFRRHGQYEHARMAADLAEAVDLAERATPRHSDQELILFGVIDHLARQQEAAQTFPPLHPPSFERFERVPPGGTIEQAQR